MTYHERYGEVTPAQLRAYKRYNVSQCDHDTLVDVFGDDPATITAYVVNYSGEGYYRPPFPVGS